MRTITDTRRSCRTPGAPDFSYPFLLGLASILFSFGRGLAVLHAGPRALARRPHAARRPRPPRGDADAASSPSASSSSTPSGGPGTAASAGDLATSSSRRSRPRCSSPSASVRAGESRSWTDSRSPSSCSRPGSQPPGRSPISIRCSGSAQTPATSRSISAGSSRTSARSGSRYGSSRTSPPRRRRSGSTAESYSCTSRSRLPRDSSDRCDRGRRGSPAGGSEQAADCGDLDFRGPGG